MFYNIRIVGIVAGCLGLLEALVWEIMVILCVLCYKEVILPCPDADNSSPIYIIYKELLTYREWDSNNTWMLHPTIFFIFMCVYIPLYLMWILSSGCLAYYFTKSKWDRMKSHALIWSVVTIAVCSLDAVISGLVLRDLIKIEDIAGIETSMYQEAYILVFFMCMKGGITWIVNIVLSILLLMSMRRGFNNSPNSDMVNRPMINAYGSSQPSLYGDGNASSNPWSSSDPYKSLTPSSPSSYYAYNNGGNFDDDNGGPGFERSNSFFPGMIPENSSPMNQISPQNTGRSATISKPGKRVSPPNSTPKCYPVFAPYIPEPDYTPPGSPVLKSSLKPRPLY